MSYDVNTPPYLDLSSNSITSNDLANIDPDDNIPSQSNFWYYTTSEFINNQQIKVVLWKNASQLFILTLGICLLILIILHKC